jgi:hypothetical protein
MIPLPPFPENVVECMLPTVCKIPRHKEGDHSENYSIKGIQEWNKG